MSKLSPLLREKLGHDPPKPRVLRLVLEVKKGKKDEVVSQLKEMGLKVDENLVSQPIPGGNYYVPVVASEDYIKDIEEMEGVVRVSKSMPVSAGVSIATPSIQPFYTIKDELLGKVVIPEVEVPRSAMFNAVPTPKSAVNALGAIAYRITGSNPLFDVNPFPTSVTSNIIKDVTTRDGAGQTVAVLDTGSPALTPQFAYKFGTLEQYSVVPEPPEDWMSHGAWCHNTVCGGVGVPSPYGGMSGVAPAVQKSIHVKCLNTFPGSGTTEGILKAIEIAVERGAKVISMSLGGPAEGDPIDGDAQARVVNQLAKEGIIFSIAGGNSGSDMYTIGSPGHAKDCISVGSASITDSFLPANWSSRGPGSDFYQDKQEEFESLLNKYGSEVIKPDCTSLGGGRAKSGAKPDEVIWSGENGWAEAMYDGIKDQTGGMHGTSQATPHVAGILACLLSDGVISNVFDAKKLLKEGTPEPVAALPESASPRAREEVETEYVLEDPINEEDAEYIAKYGKSFATGWGLFKLSRGR